MPSVPVHQIGPDDFDWSSDVGAAGELRRVVAAADEADGVENLNEAARLRLKHRGLAGSTMYAGDGGFALLHGPDLDVVVAPAARRHGLGGALARAALAGRADSTVEAWSHADHPGAARIAEQLGLARERELWVMARTLDDTVPEVTPVAGVRVRTFAEGDAPALLEVNRHAFAQHPEQGDLSLADFTERTQEEWFDAAGLFLAEAAESGDLLGFHWTKVHPGAGAGSGSDSASQQGTGEVYTVAVSPRAAGRGIGTLLTAAGLRHLRDRGLPRVILYVDADNDPAVAVYRSTGFEHVRTEAQYLGVPQV